MRLFPSCEPSLPVLERGLRGPLACAPRRGQQVLHECIVQPVGLPLVRRAGDTGPRIFVGENKTTPDLVRKGQNADQEAAPCTSALSTLAACICLPERVQAPPPASGGPQSTRTPTLVLKGADSANSSAVQQRQAVRNARGLHTCVCAVASQRAGGLQHACVGRAKTDFRSSGGCGPASSSSSSAKTSSLCSSLVIVACLCPQAPPLSPGVVAARCWPVQHVTHSLGALRSPLSWCRAPPRPTGFSCSSRRLDDGRRGKKKKKKTGDCPKTQNPPADQLSERPADHTPGHHSPAAPNTKRITQPS